MGFVDILDESWNQVQDYIFKWYPSLAKSKVLTELALMLSVNAKNYAAVSHFSIGVITWCCKTVLKRMGTD